MAKALQEIENPMIREPRILYPVRRETRIMCECDESRAIMTINGNPRCKWCAADEGVEML